MFHIVKLAMKRAVLPVGAGYISARLVWAGGVRAVRSFYAARSPSTKD